MTIILVSYENNFFEHGKYPIFDRNAYNGFKYLLGMVSKKVWKKYIKSISKLSVFMGIPYTIGKTAMMAGLQLEYVLTLSAFTFVGLYMAWIRAQLIELQTQLKSQKRILRKRCKK